MSARARGDLVLEAIDDDTVRLTDPLTRFELFMDPRQQAVLEALDGKSEPLKIAEDVLGDIEDEPQVRAFIARLSSLGLLDDGEADSVRRDRQRQTLLAEARTRRDQAVVRAVKAASETIPFHRRLQPHLAKLKSCSDLVHLPMMGKRELRDHFVDLMPEGADLGTLVESKEAMLTGTSGTTGERLNVVIDLRVPGYHVHFPGLRPIPKGLAGVRLAILTTPICAGTVCHLGGSSYEERLTPWHLTLNSSDRVMRLTRAELDNILAEIDRYRPNALQADPVYLISLLRALQRENLPLPRVNVVWSGYEYCTERYRRLIEELMSAPVVVAYGATDTGGGFGAFMCEEGVFHVREDLSVYEFVRGERPVADGELGEIVVTTLRNRLMPVIRYRTGDLARPLGYTCRCSHAHWPAFQIEGRIKDCLQTASGRLVTTRDVDQLFRGLDGVDFYQLIQHGPDDYELLAIPAPSGEGDTVQSFVERARELLGDGARVRVRRVRELSAEKSLKYRLTVSSVWSPEQW